MTAGLQDDPGHRKFYRNGIPTDVPLMDQDQDHTVSNGVGNPPNPEARTQSVVHIGSRSKANPLFVTGGSLNVSQWAPGYLPSF